jgi:hypothetical protein
MHNVSGSRYISIFTLLVVIIHFYTLFVTWDIFDMHNVSGSRYTSIFTLLVVIIHFYFKISGGG